MRSDIRAAVLAALLCAAAPAAAEPLLGPAVGDPARLLEEGRKLHARRRFADAAEVLLRASRAAPDQAPAHLALARSQLRAGRIAEACHAFRTFLLVGAAHEERAAAEKELAACEAQERARKLVPIESREEVLRNRSRFAAALEAGALDEAGAALRGLLDAGLLGPGPGEMAQRLVAAALQQGEGIHARALAREPLDEQAIRTAIGHYELVATFAVDTSTWAGRRAFLEGVIAMQSGAWPIAVERFGAAMEAAPTQTEYAFFRALALWRGGDRAGAVAALRRDLPADPHTALIEAVTAVEAGGFRGAAEVERLLFATRYPGAR